MDGLNIYGNEVDYSWLIVRDDTHWLPKVKVCNVDEIVSPVCPISGGLKTSMNRDTFDSLCDTWISRLFSDWNENKTEYRFRSTRCLRCPVHLSKKANKGRYDMNDIPEEIEIRSYDEKRMEITQPRKTRI